MKPEEIAQWVIDNRYPKSEQEKVSDFEMYHKIIEMVMSVNLPKSCIFCKHVNLLKHLEPCNFCIEYSNFIKT